MNLTPMNIFLGEHTNLELTEGRVTNAGLPPQRGRWGIHREDYEEFIDIYAGEVERGKHMHLTELHEEWGPIVIDIDFRFGIETGTERAYSDGDVRKIVELYVEQIKHYFEVQEFKGYIFEKPSPYRSDGFIKDGIHIMFPTIISEPDVQYEIRENVIHNVKENNMFSHLNLEKDYDDVFDEAVIKRSGWLMYGSSKSGQPSYKLTGVFNEKMEELEIPRQELKYLVKLFSIRNHEEESKTKVKVPLRIVKQTKVNETSSVSTSILNPAERAERLKTVRQLVELLSIKRSEDRKTWIEVGMCLYNIDNESCFELWENFSKQSAKYKMGECVKQWKSFDRYKGIDRIKLPSLNMWAKLDSPIKYNELTRASTRDIVMRSLDNTHFDVSELMWSKYRYEFVCVVMKKTTWYRFVKHRWEPMEKAIDLRKLISTEVLKDYVLLSAYFKAQHLAHPEQGEWETKVKACDKMCRSLKDRHFKDNVIKECEDQFENRKFINALDSNVNLIGFENGVYDLTRHEFRDGRPEDFVSMSTKVDFKEFNGEDKEAQNLGRFLAQILPDPEERKYVLMLVSTFLSGSTDEQKFHIWTGTGGNGKSLMMNLIENSFGEYAFKLPVTVLTQKRGGSSSCNPEIVKTKGKRFVSFQEPEKEDRIQVGYMKELTGGDTIMARGLHEDPVTFKPQFKLVLACNDLPTIGSTDGGTWRRLRVVHFKSKFVDNPDPNKEHEFSKDTGLPEKMKKWNTAFVGLLVQMYSKFRSEGKLAEPESVLKYTNEYKRKSDSFSEFVNEFIEETGNPKDHVTSTEFIARYKAWHTEEFSTALPSRTILKENLEKYFGSPPKKRCGWRNYKFIEQEPEEIFDDDDDSSSDTDSIL